MKEGGQRRAAEEGCAGDCEGTGVNRARKRAPNSGAWVANVIAEK